MRRETIGNSSSTVSGQFTRRLCRYCSWLLVLAMLASMLPAGAAFADGQGAGGDAYAEAASGAGVDGTKKDVSGEADSTSAKEMPGTAQEGVVEPGGTDTEAKAGEPGAETGNDGAPEAGQKAGQKTEQAEAGTATTDTTDQTEQEDQAGHEEQAGQTGQAEQTEQAEQIEKTGPSQNDPSQADNISEAKPSKAPGSASGAGDPDGAAQDAAASEEGTDEPEAAEAGEAGNGGEAGEAGEAVEAGGDPEASGAGEASEAGTPGQLAASSSQGGQAGQAATSDEDENISDVTDISDESIDGNPSADGGEDVSADAEGEDGDIPMEPLAGPYDVIFYVDGEQYGAVQTVPEGGTMMLPPVPDIPTGYVSFVGWFESPFATDESVPFDVTAPVTRSLNLHAVFSARYLVQFMHGIGNMVCNELSRRAYPTERISAPSADNLKKVDLPQNAVIDFWTEADTNDPDPQPFVWEEQTLAEIGHDVVLRPVFYIQVYVTFYTNAKEAAWQNPVPMKPGTTLSSVFTGGAPVPTGREIHYTFKYWTEDEDGAGAPFNFDSVITQNTKLYAYWEPIPDSATYYVAYYLEREDFTGTPTLGADNRPTDEGDFVYVGQDVMHGTPGETVTVSSLPTTPAELDDAMRYAQILPAVTGSGYSAVISPADDTVISVYATRKTYTLTFKFDLDSYSMEVGGATYKNSDPFKLDVKYGQNIAGVWPSPPLASFSLGNDAFAGYIADGANNSVDIWLTQRATANSEVMPADPNAQGYDLYTVTTYESDAQTTRYFYEQLPGETGANMFQVTGNGATKYYIEDVDMRFVGQLVSPKAITGMYAANDAQYPVLWYYAKNMNELGITAAEYNALPANERDLYKISNFFYTRRIHEFSYTNAGMPSVQVKYGAPLQELYVAQPPARQDFRFDGWSQDAPGMIPFDWGATMPDNKYAAFANWTELGVTVTFWDRYGPSSKELGTTTTSIGKTIRNIDAITFEGITYTPNSFVPGYGVFVCWEYMQSGINELVMYQTDTPLFDDQNFYARWRLTGHTITYTNDNSTYTGPLPVDVNVYQVGTNARVMNLPSGSSMVDADGFHFVGWRVQGDTSGYIYYPYTTINVDNDLVLYPVFQPVAGVVKGYFHSNLPELIDIGRINFIKNNLVPYYLPNEVDFGWYNLTGQWIIGWQTTPSGGTRYNLTDPFPVPNDVDEIHLYAVWSNSTYTVTVSSMKKDKATLLTPDAENPQNPVEFTADTGKPFTKASPHYQDWVAYGYDVFKGDMGGEIVDFIDMPTPPNPPRELPEKITATIANVIDNYAINFYYKVDTNNNRIPDEDEGPFYVEESYLKAVDEQPLEGVDSLMIKFEFPDPYVYDRRVGEIKHTGWVPVKYRIGVGEIEDIPRDDGSFDPGKPIDADFRVSRYVTADMWVTFLYKEDRNNNWIPDDEEGYLVTELHLKLADGSQVGAPVELPNMVFYSRKVGDLRAADRDWVPVSYTIDGEEHALDRLPMTPSGEPVDMDFVVEFPVTADMQVTFNYKIDTNHNDIPDDEEIYPHPDGYHVTERYVDPDGAPLEADSVQAFKYDDPLVYRRLVESLKFGGLIDWVPVGYSIDGGDQVDLDREGGGGAGTAIDKTKWVEIFVTSDFTITYTYKADTNRNWIPDDEEGDTPGSGYVVTERYHDIDGYQLKAPAELEFKAPDRLVYERLVADLRADAVFADLVPVSYVVDGGEPQGLEREGGGGRGTAIDRTQVVTILVESDFTITYTYKEDKNRNWIPDDEEDGYTVTELHLKPDGTEVCAPVEIPNLLYYSRTVGELRAPDLDWVPVAYVVDGEEHELGRLPQTPSGRPVDMDYVVGFPVAADTQVTFKYKIDTNHNDIPDDEEEYPHPDGYHVTEQYIDINGAPLEDEYVIAYKYDDRLVYDRLVEDLRFGALADYVPVSYRVDGGTINLLDREGGGGYGTAVDKAKHVVILVKSDFTIAYTYRQDLNHNWIPDDEEDGGYTVTELHLKPDGSEVSPQVTIPNLFRYRRTVGELRSPDLDWVPVAYVVDGEEHPLGRLPQTPSGRPVDMDDVVEFPVTADMQVTFKYKIDTNHNNIPDDEEEYPHPDGYHVTERYQGPGAIPLGPDATYSFMYDDPLVYDRRIGDIDIFEGYVPVSYSVDGAEPLPLPREGGIPGTGTPVLLDQHIAILIIADFTITYAYKVDKNGNKIPDDEEGGRIYKVAESYWELGGDEIAPGTVAEIPGTDPVYGKTAPPLAKWVAVGYQIGYGQASQDAVITTDRNPDGTVPPIVVPEFGVKDDESWVRFFYKADKNENGIPDDEEGVYTITEQFLRYENDALGLPLRAESERYVDASTDFAYSQDAPPISGWVAAGHRIGTAGDIDWAPYEADGKTVVQPVTAAFTVVADETVQFIYEKDTNDDGIPDRLQGPYIVTELYLDEGAGREPIQAQTTRTLRHDDPDGFLYSVNVPPIERYVAVGYIVGDEDAYYGPRDPADGKTVILPITVTVKVKDDITVRFLYKKDTNRNGIPDDEEGPYDVTETYVEYGTAPPNQIIPAQTKSYTYEDGFAYGKGAPNIEDWVAVGYRINDNEPFYETRRDADGKVPQPIFAAFDIVKDSTVEFRYKPDTNNNGIPDDEEGPFTVTELFTKVDPNDSLKAPASVTLTYQTGFKYDGEAPPITDWVAVGYQIGSQEPVVYTLKSDFPRKITVKFGVTQSTTVRYIYKPDTNNNGIPDDLEGPFTVTEKYVWFDDVDAYAPIPGMPDTYTTRTHLDGFKYAKDAPPATDWVAVGYRVDGGEPRWNERLPDNRVAQPVTARINLEADATVEFIYMKDENNNGIPDPWEDDIVVAELYVRDDDRQAQVRTATSTVLTPVTGFSYTKAALDDIADYVAVGYQVNGEPEVYAGRNADGTVPPVVVQAYMMSANSTVRFLYKDDTNNNRIPDDEEGPFTVAETYVDRYEFNEIKPATQEVFPRGGPFKYVKPAPSYQYWVAVGYKVASEGLERYADLYPDNTVYPVVAMFEVKSDDAVQFIYSKDTNENGIPDELEGSIYITEEYTDMAGAELAPPYARELSFESENGFNYDQAAKPITDWVAVGYKRGDDPPVIYTANFPREIRVQFVATRDLTVRFFYKPDTNNNGIPDELEGPFRVSERYVNTSYVRVDPAGHPDTYTDLRFDDPKGFKYSKQAPAITDWVAVGHKIGDEDAVILTGVFPLAEPYTVSFEVKANVDALFIYKPDTNNNGIPDDEEGPYTVISHHVDKYFAQIPGVANVPDTLTAQTGFVYTKKIPPIQNYVEAGYRVGAAGDVVWQEPNLDGTIPEITVTFPVTQNTDVYFIYKVDANNNRIPDEDEGKIRIQENYLSYVDGSAIKEATFSVVDDSNGFAYSKGSPDIDIVDWVCIGYYKDNEPFAAAAVGADGVVDKVSVAFVASNPAGHVVSFVYDLDTNNNGIPDRNEGPFTITERYVDAASYARIDPVGRPDTVTTLAWQGGFKYSKPAPQITDWVAAGHKIGDAPAVMLPASAFPLQDAYTVAFEATASVTVLFIYKPDTNNNGIPDEYEGPFAVDESYTDTEGEELKAAERFTYAYPDKPFVHAKTAPPITGWVAVGFQIDDAPEYIYTSGFPRAVSVTIMLTKAVTAVRFIYDVDEDGNGIPDRYETFAITWVFPNLPTQINNPNVGLTEYKTFSPDIRLLDASAVGYPFLYWTEQSDPAKNIYSGDVAIPTGSTGERTFIAHFGPYTERSLTFDGNGDRARTSATVMIPHGAMVNDLANEGPKGLVKRGYEFDGWSARRYDPTSKTNQLAMDADKTVYAYWKGVQDGAGKKISAPDEGDPDNPGVPSTPVDPGNQGGEQYVIEDPLTVELTFVGNGDVRGTIQTEQVMVHDTVDLDAVGPKGLLRIGYDFGGWSARRFDPTSITRAMQVEGDTTVYAYWNGKQNGNGKTTNDPNEPGDPQNPGVPKTPRDPARPDDAPWYVVEDPLTLTLTFDGNGDEAATVTQVIGLLKHTEVALAVFAPAGLIKPGYDFGGWSLRRYDPLTKTATVTMVDDTTVYAYWNGAQGGNGKTTNDPSEPGDPGNPGVPGTPVDPARPNDPPWFVIEDPVTATATFDGNGDIANTKVEVPVLKNGMLGMDDPRIPTGLVKYGYDFDGWTTVVNNPNKRATGSVRVAGDMELYAYWKGDGGNGPVDPDDPDGPWTPEKPIYVNVIFDGNGDNNRTVQTVPILKHQPINVADYAPQVSRSGHRLTGWSLVANNESTAVASIAPVADTRLYALWTLYTQSGTGGGGHPNTGGATTIPGNPPVDIEDPGLPYDPAIPPEFIHDHVKYINGYPDGTMHPDAAITRAETAAIIFRLLSDPNKNSPLGNPFSDVPDYEWHAQSIKYLASTGIVVGDPDGSFRPDAPITRAEFAKMVAGYDRLGIVGGTQFPDTAGHWAEGYINSAANRGWVSGYPDGLFQPENFITRAEVVSTVNRMLKRSISDRSVPSWATKFPDVPSSHWAYLAIVEAATAHDYVYEEDGNELWDYSTSSR